MDVLMSIEVEGPETLLMHKTRDRFGKKKRFEKKVKRALTEDVTLMKVHAAIPAAFDGIGYLLETSLQL